jgi:hypothetical protein
VAGVTGIGSHHRKRRDPRRDNAMSTITVARTNVTSEEVTEALRDGLGPGYNVRPGLRMVRNPFFPSFGKPHPDSADVILVGNGSNRFGRAQVEVRRDAQQTLIEVSPAGIAWVRLANARGIARKTREVLAQLDQAVQT